MTIGEKIKYLRKEKKITQAALCGDAITRNMLSRIEHGAALPSLPTLKHLADTLGVSAGYFLDDTDEKHPYQKLAIWPSVKQAFADRDYAACLHLTADLEKDDEVAYIEATALYTLGHESYLSGKLTTAERLLKSAEESASLSLYAASLLALCRYDLSMIAKVKENKLPEPMLNDTEPHGEEIEYYLYLYMLHVTKTARYDLAASIYDTLKFQSTVFRKHINARLSQLAHNNSRAVTLLKELSDEMKDGKSDPLFTLTVLSDLETAAGTIGDYEEAYHALLLKNQLLEGFSK